ncbi:hypothetical protein [Trinickia acidisoli]|uniref:hypothetical protein n=1 Tax=Trinickia acidisoli TaxID=2767482 RepID=UPI001A8EA436|nr:hypothetical protein [Trinickia acidisoli]
MKISLWASAALLALSTAAFAQRPLVYPLRSQSGAAQGVDNAYCYWQARKQTGVDMARQSQRPVRTKPIQFTPDAGRGASEPPLPAPRGMPGGASRAAQAGAAADAAGGASKAGSAPTVASQSHASSVPNAVAGQATASASGSAGAASAASSNLPPLPPPEPPEPPMTAYWQAYGDCMQARGYGVQ